MEASLASDFDRSVLKRYPGKHLMLQPHLDDIAFSIGHMIHDGLLKPVDNDIRTVFSLEWFNIRQLPFDQHTVSLLWEEEEQWFLQEGLQFSRMPLEEAGYRGVNHVRKLFLTGHADKHDLDYASLGYGNWEDVLHHIGQALEGFDYIWAPAGIGGHCDHLSVRHAVMKLAAERANIKGLFMYEELPYRIYSRPILWDQFHIEGFAYREKIHKAPDPQEVRRKCDSLAAYYTQIDDRQALALSAEDEVVVIWLRTG
jgi:hypothetical protein